VGRPYLLKILAQCDLQIFADFDRFLLLEEVDYQLSSEICYSLNPLRVAQKNENFPGFLDITDLLFKSLTKFLYMKTFGSKIAGNLFADITVHK